MVTNSKKMFLMLVLAAGIISSCNKNGGFKKTESGLLYKFHVENEKAKTPKEGDFISIHFVLQTKDTTLQDTRKSSPEPISIILPKAAFKGDLSEAFTMLHIGDSATFKIVADTFFTKLGSKELPQGVKKGSELMLHVKLYKIQSKDEFEKAQNEKMIKLQEKEYGVISEYMAKNNLKATPTESGLYYIETKKGTGAQPTANKTVSVHYTGYFLSGSVFDSSIERGKPIEFPVGVGQVISGWDEAIQLMKVGGKAKVIIPWWLAYGPNGYGQAIPAFATLVFDMELVAVK